MGGKKQCRNLLENDAADVFCGKVTTGERDAILVGGRKTDGRKDGRKGGDSCFEKRGKKEKVFFSPSPSKDRRRLKGVKLVTKNTFFFSYFPKVPPSIPKQGGRGQIFGCTVRPFLSNFPNTRMAL